MRTFSGVAELRGCIGGVLGVSEWTVIDQERINRFAAVSDDWQWIHTDAERAAAGPFGTTVAHGYLTLSLLARFSWEQFELTGSAVAVNCGLNRVRFPAPVPPGSRLRAAGRLDEVRDLPGGWTELTITQTVEIDGGSRPACVATTLSRVRWT
jgi:acyl dehydratase